MNPQAMHLRLFDDIPVVFAFAAACNYVVVAVFMLLSGGMLGVRGWPVTKPAWADLSTHICQLYVIPLPVFTPGYLQGQVH
jgi:hypothetical protein